MKANKSLQLHVRGIFKSKLALLDSKWYVHVIMKMENNYFVIHFREVYSEFETTVPTEESDGYLQACIT